MKIKETLPKMGLAIFAYMIAYDSVVLAALHPEIPTGFWDRSPNI